MKLVLFLAPLHLASAFVETPRGIVGSSALRAIGDDKFETTQIRDVRDVVSGVDSLDTRVPPPNGFANTTPLPLADGPAESPKRRTPRTSQALPFVAWPATLDGTLAGDAGFDPLGFADGPRNLANYREAEIKHGRLAMLAAAGWPLSELWDAKLARALDMAPALNPDGRVPSVLNGGMGGISLAYWLGCLALAAALDVYGSYFATKRSEYVAGDLGFDPLGLYPRGDWDRDEQKRERLRLAEIKHGRLAMIAITIFAAQEFVTHVPVVDQTPIFFHPITEVLFGDAVSTVSPAATAAAEAVSSIATEAPAVAPEIALPAFVETASQAGATAAAEAAVVAPDAVAPAVAEAGAVVPPTSVTESLSTTAVDAATADELAGAKTRIVELEARLAQIDALIR